VRPAPKITPKFVVAVVEQAREIAAEEATRAIPSRLGMAVVLTGVALMTWGVMRSTWAQDTPKPTAPAAVPKPAPIPVQERAPSASTDLPPRTTDAVPEASVPKLPDSTPGFDNGSHQAIPTNSEIGPAASRLPAGENDDPEKTVQAFVEQNRKVAESQLKNLKDEGEKLRGRLQKVEGGIKRWEALLAALEKSSAAASSKGLSLTEPRLPETLAPRTLESAPLESRVDPPPTSAADLSPAPAPTPPQRTPR
jgi:hypothetical protein